MKTVAEKVEMGLDAQKSFVQVYEDRYMNKRIGGKMIVRIDGPRGGVNWAFFNF